MLLGCSGWSLVAKNGPNENFRYFSIYSILTYGRYLGMAYQMATKYDPGASIFEFIVFPRGGAQLERPRWHGLNFRVKRDKNEGASHRIVMRLVLFKFKTPFWRSRIFFFGALPRALNLSIDQNGHHRPSNGTMEYHFAPKIIRNGSKLMPRGIELS